MMQRWDAVEVGRLLKAYGVMGSQRQKAIRQLGEAAEGASRWLWCKRGDNGWKMVITADVPAGTKHQGKIGAT